MSATDHAARTFEAHLEPINLSGTRLGYVLVAVLMPAGMTLDLVMHPEWALPFLWIRLASSVVALGLNGLTYIEREGEVPLWLQSAPPLVAAVAIEAMIVILGGVESPYYAGLNLTILAMAVLFTWTWRHALVVSGLIVLMWIVPGIPSALDGSLDWRVFFNNFYFLAITTVIAVSATAMRFRATRREYDAQVALAETSTELAGTLEQLRESDRLKSEFFANVSHELRTPLTLILAPIDELLANADGGDDGLRNSLVIMRRNAGRLLRMIDDLLDLARLEGGRLRLNVASIDLVEEGERVVANARPAAGTRDIELTFASTELGDVCLGDPHRIEIILTNLVNNAVKFTPSGGRVEVKLAEDAGMARMVVSDTGPGVPEEHHQAIFRRFYQVHGSERRRHGGAGIGLALSRELARLHGGDVTVANAEGGGAVFTFVLPLGSETFDDESVERRRVQLEEHPRRRADDSAVEDTTLDRELGRMEPIRTGEPILLDRGRRPHIIVAEDEEDLRLFIERMLSSDFDVSTAVDGEEAGRIAREKGADLILTDVMMPGTSGTDLCRAIKSDPILRQTPVIMLTARTGSDAALDAYAAGADDFVAKPFHVQVLIARVRAHLALRSLSIQLADQARLATAGALAAGVAHEIRNPLNAIVNAARVIEDGGSRKVSQEALLAVICDGVSRIDDVVSALDAHVRPADGMNVSHCDVVEGIEASVRLLGHRMDAVQVVREFDAKGSVRAAARELNQILLNLIDNAVSSGASKLWLRVEREGGKVRITVRDDGSGIPNGLRHRIFDPFFTTRAPGEGTGLGLYLSRKMARETGGDLRLSSAPSGGATFILELPDAEWPRNAPREAAEGDPQVPGLA